MSIQDKPQYGKVYSLTAFKIGGPSIAAGNTWAESEVTEQELDRIGALGAQAAAARKRAAEREANDGR